MKRQKILVAVISVVLFLAALLLGANTVFSVSRIDIAFGVSSPQARAHSLALQRTLEEEYLGENIFFVQRDRVTAAFDGYPYLSVISFEKSYPDKLVLSVEEKLESYAAAVEEESGTVFYMLSADGSVLRKSAENKNNVDGGENFRIEGLRYSASDGFSSDGNFRTVLEICARLDEAAGGIRTAFASLAVSSDATGTELTVYTREGVEIRVGDPASHTEEKIGKALEMYLALEDKDKLFGYITVRDNADGSGIVGPTYTPRD